MRQQTHSVTRDFTRNVQKILMIYRLLLGAYKGSQNLFDFFVYVNKECVKLCNTFYVSPLVVLLTLRLMRCSSEKMGGVIFHSYVRGVTLVNSMRNNCQYF